MNGRALIALASVALLAGLSGCYESPDVTVHKPGVYKGAYDPLLDKVRTQEHQQALRERFNQVQTDRARGGT